MNKEKLRKLVNIAFRQKALKAKESERPYRIPPAVSSKEWEDGRKMLLDILEE